MGVAYETVDEDGWPRLVIRDKGSGYAVTQIIVAGQDDNHAMATMISENHCYTVDDLAALGRTFTALAERLAASGEDYL